MAAKGRRFFLIRHGETEFNRLGVFRGRFEVDLNDRGRKQAEEIGEALRGEGIEIVYTSPLGRAVETAEIVGNVLGLSCEISEAFNNIALGKWQGVPKDEIKREYPEEWKLWTTEPERLKIPDGETVEDVRLRSFDGLMQILKERDATFAVVTHRSVIKTLGASILKVPPPYFWKFYIDNAAFSVFEHSLSGFTLLSWNSNAHLSDKVTEVF
jgi:broad specificity phosphatase PhoE